MHSEAASPQGAGGMSVRRVLGGMAVYGSADAAVGAVRIGLAALYTRVLDPSQFGVLALVYVSVTLALTLLPLGLPAAVMTRFRPGQTGAMRRDMDAAYGVLLPVCLLLAAGAAIGDCLGGVGSLDRGVLFASALWAGSGVLAHVPMSSLRFRDKVFAFSLARLSYVVALVAVLAFFLLTSHVGLSQIVYAETAGSLASLLLAHLLDGYAPRPRGADLRVLLLAGAPFCLLAMGHFVIDLVDRYIVAGLMGTAATGYYAAAARIAVAGSLLAEALNSMWLPYFYRLAGSGGLAAAAVRLVSRRLLYVLAGLLALAMALLPWVAVAPVAGRSFIAQPYHAAMALVAPLLLQYFFKMCYYVATPAINFHGRTWRQVSIVYGAGVFNAAANVAVITFSPFSSPYATLTLVALVTALSYGGGMVLVLRELGRLYPGGGPGGLFMSGLTVVVLLPLLPVAVGVKVGLVLLWAGVVAVGYRRDLLPGWR